MTDNFDASKPSEGLGDTIAKITHAIGIDKVAEGVARAVGREDCGCNRRRETLNKLFPYQTKTPSPIPTPIDTSLYEYEGTKTFKVLTQFAITIDGKAVEYEPGVVIPVSNGDHFYPALKSLLYNNNIEYIA